MTPGGVPNQAGAMDTNAISRWLDDVGLPQYKDSFLEARLDGRVLDTLTVDETTSNLKVTSLLHMISLRRGVQVRLSRVLYSLGSEEGNAKL